MCGLRGELACTVGATWTEDRRARGEVTPPHSRQASFELLVFSFTLSAAHAEVCDPPGERRRTGGDHGERRTRCGSYPVRVSADLAPISPPPNFSTE